MNHRTNTTRVNIGLKALAWTICILAPLSASSFQAGRFLQSMGQGADSWIMLLTGCAIIFSSPIVGILSGIAFRNGSLLGWAGILTWCVIVLFSTSTSSLAILNTTGSTIQNQVSDSPRVQAMQATVNANMNAIKEKQAQIDGRDPIRWASKRDGWANDIRNLNTENMALLSKLKQANDSNEGSSMGQAFDSLAAFHVTPARLAILASLLLDLIPFVAGLLLGANAGRVVASVVNAGGSTGKKSKPSLKAVAA